MIEISVSFFASIMLLKLHNVKTCMSWCHKSLNIWRELCGTAREIGEKTIEIKQQQQQDNGRKRYLNIENTICINLIAFRIIFCNKLTGFNRTLC